MLGRFTLNFDMTSDELIEVMKKIRVIRKKQMRAGTYRLKWTNFQNPEKLELIDMDFEHMSPFKCFGKVVSKGEKCSLEVQYRPTIIIFVFIGLFSCPIAYAIITFGIHNYGAQGFYPSIFVPTFLIGLIYMGWFFKFLLAVREIRAKIEESIEERISMDELN